MAKRKKRKTRTCLLVVVLCLLLAGGYSLYQFLKQEKQVQMAALANYAAFGIDIPLQYSIHGIDVSVHQSFIHWPAVKQMKVQNVQVAFVFIKATEGLNDADKQFKYNWRTLKKDTLTRGAYHFFLATKSGKLQAENFIQSVQLKKGDLPPAVDIEQLYDVPETVMRARLKEYLQTIEAYYKVKPIIYSYADFYERYLGKGFDDYPLWVAHYEEKDKPRIRRSWQFWQHNNHGHVNGITTNVDFNVFKGDSAQFQQMLIQ